MKKGRVSSNLIDKRATGFGALMPLIQTIPQPEDKFGKPGFWKGPKSPFAAAMPPEPPPSSPVPMSAQHFAPSMDRAAQSDRVKTAYMATAGNDYIRQPVKQDRPTQNDAIEAKKDGFRRTQVTPETQRIWEQARRKAIQEEEKAGAFERGKKLAGAIKSIREHMTKKLP